MEITFKKTGQAIKRAVNKRQADLLQRLEESHVALADFLQRPDRVRDYLLFRLREEIGADPFAIEEEIKEEHAQIRGLCEYIVGLEDELYRLAMIERHLDDAEIFSLTVDEMIRYGFDLEAQF
ncbi:MAG: hypothetical protein R2880_19790 [Deinococcales bacterium]